MNNLLKAILVSSAIILASVISLPVYSDEVSMGAVIANVKTPADHEALAARYESDAKAVQEQINMHKQMAGNYRALGPKSGAGFAVHCDRIVKAYETIAREDDELAKLHHKQAAEATK